MNQIEEIWFEDNSVDAKGEAVGEIPRGGNSIGQLVGIPTWVKDMENLQWIR